MIGQILPLKQLRFSRFERWVYPLSISLIAHVALIVLIFLNDADISEPILPKTFKVEIVTEQKSWQQEPIPENSKNSIESTSAINLISNEPQPKEILKRKKNLHPSKYPPQKAENPIYAPLPKRKPVLASMRLSYQNIKNPRLQQPYTEDKLFINLDTPVKQKTYSETDKSTKVPFLSTPPNLKGGGAKTPVIRTKPPRPDSEANNPYPQYPNRARRRGLEGGLILRVTVNIKGAPSAIEVIKTSGHEILDRAAVKAVRNWQFQPAKKGEKPVKASVNLPVEFRLREKPDDNSE